MGEHGFWSVFLLLFLIIDSFAILPIYLAMVQPLARRRRFLVTVREAAIAYAVLLAFMLGGHDILDAFGLDQQALRVAGGVILLLVSIRMIFSNTAEIFGASRGQEPLVFPLAVPLLAGPAAMTTVMLLGSTQPERLPVWIAALSAAMAVSAALLLAAERLLNWVGPTVLRAAEKLMGMLLAAVAVDMVLVGLRTYFEGH